MTDDAISWGRDSVGLKYKPWMGGAVRSARGMSSTPVRSPTSWSGSMVDDVADRLASGTSCDWDIGRVASSLDICSTSDAAENREDGDSLTEGKAEHEERGE